MKNITVTVQDTVVSRPLNSQWRLKSYPNGYMPFYLYGNNGMYNSRFTKMIPDLP